MSTNVGSIHYDLDLKKDKFDRQSSSISSSLKSLGKKFVAFSAVAVAAVAAVFGKFVMAGGISRALNIEDAQAKLRGLGHDAKAIENIMDSALKSVKGTAFGLDAAATAAASAVAAGIEPGKDLTRVLALTGDTATITGKQFNEAGAIINKVLASNRLSMEEVNQMMDAGLPILSMLADEYDTTAASMRDMVSNGEIDSKKFLKAIETNISGAALESGNTTRGAWENLKAAMARVGANIAEDILPKVKNAFGDLTRWFDENSEKIVQSISSIFGTFQRVFGGIVNWISTNRGFFTGLKTSFLEIKDGVQQLISQALDYLMPKLQALWEEVARDVIPTLKRLWKEVLEPLMPVIGGALVVAIGLAIDWLRLFIQITDRVTDVMLTLTSAVVTSSRKIVSAVMSIWNGVRDAFVWSVGKIVSVINWFRNLKQSAKDMANGVREALSNLKNSISGSLDGLWGTFVDAGWAMMRGLATGIWDAAWMPINAIKDVAGKVRDFLPFSPAKVGPFSGKGWTPYSGEAMMEGLAQGIQRNNRLPAQAMSNAVGRVKENVSTDMSTRVYGNISIGSEVDSDRFFARLSRNQELSSKGLSTLKGTV